MSEMTEKLSVGKPVQLKTEAGRPALDVNYPSLEESLQRAEMKYERDRADYFNTLADEPVLLSKTKRWQKSARDYMQWAGALFNADKCDNDSRKHAMEIMDRITKESGIRHRNMWKHGDLRIAQAEENSEKTPQELEELKEEMDRAESETGAFFRSAIKTQVHYGELFEKGETYVSPRQEMERDAAARCQELRDHVLPKDHVYIPGRIIPPHPVPRGQRVPKEPDPYTLAESQPIEAYEFDRELDEYVIKKGYVSEDGLIDDQSVVIDPKAGKITMKYRGGTPVTWDWWKAKDTGDLPEEGSWAAEYLYREFHQMLDDLQPGILKHQDYEDEIPDYNKIPGTNLRYNDIYE